MRQEVSPSFLPYPCACMKATVLDYQTHNIEYSIHRVMTIPSLQQAAVKTGEGPSARCEVQTIDVHMPGPGQILCKINYSGLCGADKSLLYDEWVPMGLMPKRDYHGILGHEGVGTVAAVADDVKGLWKEGDRIGVKWVSSICRTCEFCTNGLDELQCPEQLNSGFSTPGRAF